MLIVTAISHRSHAELNSSYCSETGMMLPRKSCGTDLSWWPCASSALAGSAAQGLHPLPDIFAAPCPDPRKDHINVPYGAQCAHMLVLGTACLENQGFLCLFSDLWAPVVHSHHVLSWSGLLQWGGERTYWKKSCTNLFHSKCCPVPIHSH